MYPHLAQFKKKKKKAGQENPESKLCICVWLPPPFCEDWWVLSPVWWLVKSRGTLVWFRSEGSYCFCFPLILFCRLKWQRSQKENWKEGSWEVGESIQCPGIYSELGSTTMQSGAHNQPWCLSTLLSKSSTHWNNSMPSLTRGCTWPSPCLCCLLFWKF
jgi:hypothetical protein